MSTKLFAMLLLFALTACKHSVTVEGEVAGAEAASDRELMGLDAVLGSVVSVTPKRPSELRGSCSGVLLNARTVAFSDRCTFYANEAERDDNASNYKIQFGANVATSNPGVSGVGTVERLPGRDVAWMRLATPVEGYNQIEVFPDAQKAELIQGYAEILVLGYGIPDDGRPGTFGTRDWSLLLPGDFVNHYDVTRVQRSEASVQVTTRHPYNNGFSVTPKSSGQGFCEGDWGGPAFVSTAGTGWHFVGLASASSGCSAQGYLAYAADLARSLNLPVPRNVKLAKPVWTSRYSASASIVAKGRCQTVEGRSLFPVEDAAGNMIGTAQTRSLDYIEYVRTAGRRYVVKLPGFDNSRASVGDDGEPEFFVPASELDCNL